MQAAEGPSSTSNPLVEQSAPVEPIAPTAALTTERLVADHFEALYRFAYRLSHSQAEAEDLTQEAFLIAHRQLHQLREAVVARKWLYRILHSCWYRACRQRGKETAVEWDASNEPALEPKELVDSSELQAALEKLPDEFRAPVVLFYFDELKYREIAEVLDCPIGTVMSRIARGKSLLRGLLSDPT